MEVPEMRAFFEKLVYLTKAGKIAWTQSHHGEQFDIHYRCESGGLKIGYDREHGGEATVSVNGSEIDCGNNRYPALANLEDAVRNFLKSPPPADDAIRRFMSEN